MYFINIDTDTFSTVINKQWLYLHDLPGIRNSFILSEYHVLIPHKYYPNK